MSFLHPFYNISKKLYFNFDIYKTLQYHKNVPPISVHLADKLFSKKTNNFYQQKQDNAMKSSKQKILAFLAIFFSSGLTGHIFVLLLKYAQNMPTGLIDTDGAWGALVFMIIPIHFLWDWANEHKPKQTNLQAARGGYSSVSAIVSSLRPVKINGRPSFLKTIDPIKGGFINYREPKKTEPKQVQLLKTIKIDSVFFTSYDNNGSLVQIPESTLWRLLKFAEKNRRYGVGLSERSLTGKGGGKNYVYVLGNAHLYWPIINLLFAVQNESVKWIKPDGVEIIKTLPNNWNILMPSASMTYRMCVIYQFGDEINPVEVKRILRGSGRNLGDIE
jgi:hypothetical protein